MGILDDLREEANLKQSEQQEDAIAREKLEHNYQVLILPKMQQLYSYFKELLEYLKIIEKPVKIAQYSNRYHGLGELVQQDYKLSTDKHGGIANFEKLTEITLKFYCENSAADELKYLAESQQNADQEKDFLASRKIKFRQDRSLGNTSEGATTFYIQRRIPVFFQFRVDYENSRIKLIMLNHENFEKRSQYIDPDTIDENFMDKLARYILRKDQDFIRIELDEQSKEKIRQSVQAQKREHQAELEAAILRDLEEAANAEHSSSFSKRVKAFIKKSSG